MVWDWPKWQLLLLPMEEKSTWIPNLEKVLLSRYNSKNYDQNILCGRRTCLGKIVKESLQSRKYEVIMAEDGKVL